MGVPGRATSIRPSAGWPLEDVQTERVQRLDDRLEERRPAGGAVAAAAGGEAEGDGAAVERAAAVARLGAHGRADEPGDPALGVGDGRVELLHRAAVDAGGAAATGHG